MSDPTVVPARCHLPAVFTLCWSVQASLTESDGLWPVGAFLVLLGTSVAAVLLWALVPPRSR